MPHTFETEPIEVERFYTGVISQRNKLAVPIRVFGRRLIELYDAITSGSNAELTVRATLQRAAGYIQYNTNTVSGIPQKYYAFQPVGQPGTIYPIVDTTTGVFFVPPGSSAPTTIISKTQPTQSSFFGLGNYLYIGNAAFSQKWDTGSPQGVTNWGIRMSAGAVTDYAGASVGTSVGLNTSPWTNIANSQGAPDGAYATSPFNVTFAGDIPSGTEPQRLDLTTYGFAIPAGSIIDSVVITLTGFASYTAGQGLGFTATLVGPGYSQSDATQVFPTTAGGSVTFSFPGGPFLPTAAQINSGTFGIRIRANYFNNPAATNTGTLSIDAVGITVNYGPLPVVMVNAGAGTFSATQGYQYVFVYGNSNDNNISNPTPASATTGVFTNKLRTEITLTASTDPQVNQIRVFRTTDTGTGAVFFELPNSPFANTSATVFDTAADTALTVSQAVVVGTLAFSPPPAGLVNIEWYAGRLWGSVGNLLYFSAGPDNAPMGRGTSNWPPGNVFELPTQIVKNVALNGGNGMLVVTVDGIHVVQGISNPGFTVNRWLSDVGARQQNAVDTDGSNIYIFTSDRQFLRISAQGIEELSQGISDQTDVLDPTLVYVCQHRSGSQDSRVFLTDGSAKWIPYNLMMGAWEPAKTPVDGSGMGAIGSIEIQPGVMKLLKGDTRANQVIQQRDQNTFSDNGTNYSWNAIFGNIPLTDPTQLANVESLVLRLTNVGSLPTVSILPNDISGTFAQLGPPRDEPPEGATPPTGHQAKKYYLGTGKSWTQMMHLQIQFTFGAEAAQNEILSWGLFPNESTDQQVGAIPQIQGR